jgi:hypothetical protein
MKTWILILAVYWGNSPAITSHEFNSKETCEAAGKTFSDVGNVEFKCVEK